MPQALRVVEQLRLLRDRTVALARTVGGVESDLELAFAVRSTVSRSAGWYRSG